MSDNAAINYPDILGTITNGQRINLSAVQVAMTVRPFVVRAGRPFEVIMLIQNASNVKVDVGVKLQMPERDANKKKGRFVTKVDHLVIGVAPSEVGYVVLPMSSMPDTAVSPEYKVGMELVIKPLGKPQRTRLPDGGGEVPFDHLKAEVVEKINELKRLKYSVSKHLGLGTTLEASFSLMSGRVGSMTDLQPAWVSLWTMADFIDDRELLKRFHETLRVKVLPMLGRESVFKPLLDETTKRFAEAGFTLKSVEANFIARLLALLLEYSVPERTSNESAAGIYNILPLLNAERLASSDPLPLPKWVGGYLRALVRDERAARFPVMAITEFAYNDLLSDAMHHAFEIIEVNSGESMGGNKEREEYIQQVLHLISEKKLDITHVYMPLVMGGIIMYDRMLLENEKLGELLDDMRTILDERGPELSSEDTAISRLTSRLIDQAMMKYGYRNT